MYIKGKDEVEYEINTLDKYIKLQKDEEKFNSVKILKICLNDEEITIIPPHLRVLILGTYFNGKLPEFMETHFNSFEILILGDKYNKPLPTNIESCKELKKLILGKNFNQNVPKTIFTKTKIEELVFGHRFKKTIPNNIKNCTTLRKIKFNCPHNIEFPQSLEEIHYADDFNKRINKFPPFIKRIYFGSCFNKPLPKDLLNYERLTYIKLPDYYNLPLPKLPINIKHLILGKKYNQVIDLNNKIKKLELGYYYDCQLPELKGTNLRKLILGYCYNQPLPELKGTNITVLKMGHLYNQPLPELNESNLKILELGHCYNQQLPELKTSKITCLRLGFLYDKSIPELPKLLKYLTISNYINPLPELPKLLKYLKISNCANEDTLPELPASLKYLHLPNYYDVQLPELKHTRLKYIYIGYSYKKIVPELPNTVNHLLLYNPKYNNPSFKVKTLMLHPNTNYNIQKTNYTLVNKIIIKRGKLHMQSSIIFRCINDCVGKFYIYSSDPGYFLNIVYSKIINLQNKKLVHYNVKTQKRDNFYNDIDYTYILRLNLLNFIKYIIYNPVYIPCEIYTYILENHNFNYLYKIIEKMKYTAKPL